MKIDNKVDAVYIPDSPSRIKATDYNQIKNEIQECITLAGLTPTKDVIQLPQALKILTAQSGAEEVAKIEAAGQEQLDAVNTAGETQTAAVNAAGQKQLNAINTAGAQAVQDAQTAANTATAKATEAAGSASAAASSASAASGSASTATTQATNAAGSAELAQKWATQTTAEVVSGQGYGAKYYADQAADSAASIVGDAEAAAASATAAAQSAQQAAQSAAVIDPDTYVKKSGDTMSGMLTLAQGAKITNGFLEFANGIAIRLLKKDGTNYLAFFLGRDNIFRLFDIQQNKGFYLDSNDNYKPCYFDGTTGYPLAYIKEKYSDGQGNWYRVWSDGLLEQYGTVSAGGHRTVTLLKPFFTSNYSVFVSGRLNMGAGDTCGLTINSNTSFDYSSETAFSWYAVGSVL